VTIIFYDKKSEKIHICTEHEATKVISTDDPHLLDFVPNDDILYVESAHQIKKSQLEEWLKDGVELKTTDKRAAASRKAVIHNEASVKYNDDSKFIHPNGNGTILIEDIQTDKFPNGIVLHGKWDFLAVDEVGEDVLEDSRFYKILLNRKKIKVVDFRYVKENIHKKYKHQSQVDKELDRILVKDDRPGAARKVSAEGLTDDHEGAISIEIVGD